MFSLLVLHRGNAQHATISSCFTTKDHMAAGIAVAVVSIVVVRFMAVWKLAPAKGDPTELYDRSDISSRTFSKTMSFLVLEQGFEPRLPEPESGVLPLDDSRMEGEVEFESTTSRAKTWCSIQLNYSPTCAHVLPPGESCSRPGLNLLQCGEVDLHRDQSCSRVASRCQRGYGHRSSGL